jgi:hypothetical protein
MSIGDHFDRMLADVARETPTADQLADYLREQYLEQRETPPLRTVKYGMRVPLLVHPDAPRGGASPSGFGSVWIHPIDWAAHAHAGNPHAELDAVREHHVLDAGRRLDQMWDRLHICPDCEGEGRFLVKTYRDDGVSWSLRGAYCPRCAGTGSL